MTEFRGGADDIVIRFSELAANAGLDQQKISNIAKTVRTEFAGSFIYVKKTDPSRDRRVIDSFRRLRSVRQVSKEMNIPRMTIYRILNKGNEK